jgi:hypothetical protein
MIRDPSDGSVREKIHVDETTGKSAAANQKANAGNDLGMSTSGLPFGSTKPESLERLNKSREWLKNYHENPNPRGNEQ